jgi:tRNA A-37 threonylcarbamoyl transferase component Bud32
MREVTDDMIIGRGRTAAVYDIGDGKVLKLFYGEFPRAACERECKNAEALNDTGIRAPRCFGLKDVDGRTGIVYERVAGRSLLDRLSSSPGEAREIAKSLAALQYSMRDVSVGGLTDQKEYLSAAIFASTDALGSRLPRIIERLGALEGGNAVCHGDLHPGNVIESEGGLYMIDWMAAVRGNLAGDVARTWLLLNSPFMPDGVPFFMRFLSGALKKYLLRLWLREYFALSGASFGDIRKWILPLAAARLRENVPGEDRWLMRLIDAELRD